MIVLPCLLFFQSSLAVILFLLIVQANPCNSSFYVYCARLTIRVPLREAGKAEVNRGTREECRFPNQRHPFK
jgi:hypothetical protein